MEVPTTSSTTTYNILHNEVDEDNADLNEEMYDDDEEEEEHHQQSHKHETKQGVLESFDFNDSESMMWRKVRHQFFLKVC